MNKKSLNLIREVVVNSGKLAAIEMAQDSIYMDFKDVELGKPRLMDEMLLTVRFAQNSFFAVFYNDIWDIDFLSRYDYKNQILSEEVYFEVKEIRFIDFEYLNTFFYNFKSEKTILSPYKNFDIHNISSDFFMLVETDKLAFVVGADQMNFFTPFERLDDMSLKELSNDWMLYFLKYHLKRNIIKDPMCENHPLLRDRSI